MIDHGTPFKSMPEGIVVGPWRILCACTDSRLGAALILEGNGVNYDLILSPRGRKAQLFKRKTKKRRAAK